MRARTVTFQVCVRAQPTPIALIYTIIESAKMNGRNPQAYLTDILGRIADHPINKIDALLPWLWTQ